VGAVTAVSVAIHWTITRDESTEIFRSRTEQTNVELAIRAELAKLRASAVLTKPVRKISVVYVYTFALLNAIACRLC
jgi:hypothetical protein